ncbi:MAG: hypothetical protein NPIRA04_24720 [Nitrospirales bacterium]|nr:MAG: hypothetical protein NPIRA04_24720 [Nitrospirales bacterium]
MGRKAERYRLSSAASHCHIREDPVLTTKVGWWAQFNAIDDWSSWLAKDVESKDLAVMQRNTEKGLPSVVVRRF